MQPDIKQKLSSQILRRHVPAIYRQIALMKLLLLLIWYNDYSTNVQQTSLFQILPVKRAYHILTFVAAGFV